MDADRFDHLARVLLTSTRRSALGGLLGAALGSALGRGAAAANLPACPTCGRCTACTTEAKCNARCERSCAAAKLCRVASRDAAYRSLAARLARLGFRPRAKPEAFELQDGDEVVRVSLAVRFAHSKRRADSAWLLYRSSEAAALVVPNRGTAYALTVVGGVIKRVDPPAVLAAGRAPRASGRAGDAECQKKCDKQCQFLHVTGCGGLGVLAKWSQSKPLAFLAAVAAAYCGLYQRDDFLTVCKRYCLNGCEEGCDCPTEDGRCCEEPRRCCGPWWNQRCCDACTNGLPCPGAVDSCCCCPSQSQTCCLSPSQSASSCCPKEHKHRCDAGRCCRAIGPCPAGCVDPDLVISCPGCCSGFCYHGRCEETTVCRRSGDCPDGCCTQTTPSICRTGRDDDACGPPAGVCQDCTTLDRGGTCCRAADGSTTCCRGDARCCGDKDGTCCNKEMACCTIEATGETRCCDDGWALEGKPYCCPEGSEGTCCREGETCCPKGQGAPSGCCPPGKRCDASGCL